MHQLRHGARSNAEPAKVSSYQPNHKGAEDHADQLEEILGGELAAGIMEQTESPPCFPICIRPMSVIAKMAVKDAVLRAALRFPKCLRRGEEVKKSKFGLTMS